MGRGRGCGAPKRDSLSVQSTSTTGKGGESSGSSVIVTCGEMASNELHKEKRLLWVGILTFGCGGVMTRCEVGGDDADEND